MDIVSVDRFINQIVPCAHQKQYADIVQSDDYPDKMSAYYLYRHQNSRSPGFNVIMFEHCEISCLMRFINKL